MGVGWPADHLLHEFGSQVWAAFGLPPYLVGSALAKKRGWRDVDVRLILPDEDYTWWQLGDPKDPRANERWVSLCLAYCALGRAVTGLPIDFQIQQQTLANEQYPGSRSALGIIPLRRAVPAKPTKKR